MTITCNLKGGLGNQLFQIFAVLSYSFQYKHSFKFQDVKMLINGKNKRTTYWDTLFREVRKLLLSNHLPPFIMIKETVFHYIPISPYIFQSYENICLDGYYQSYKYFEKYYPTIIKILQIEKKRELIKNKYNDPLSLNQCISIHFRLGDYKNVQHVHPIMTIDYYEKALEHIFTRSKHSYPLDKVIYFCEMEDIDNVNESIQLLNNKFPEITFQLCPEDLEDWEQMLLMSCCAHNIIANSTFSWWGAYFNTNPNQNKTVCYPAKWFAEGTKMNTNDLCPPDWVKIE